MEGLLCSRARFEDGAPREGQLRKQRTLVSERAFEVIDAHLLQMLHIGDGMAADRAGTAAETLRWLGAARLPHSMAGGRVCIGGKALKS